MFDLQQISVEVNLQWQLEMLLVIVEITSCANSYMLDGRKVMSECAVQ